MLAQPNRRDNHQKSKMLLLWYKETCTETLPSSIARLKDALLCLAVHFMTRFCHKQLHRPYYVLPIDDYLGVLFLCFSFDCFLTRHKNNPYLVALIFAICLCLSPSNDCLAYTPSKDRYPCSPLYSKAAEKMLVG
jgi:hypothetical protein